MIKKILMATDMGPFTSHMLVHMSSLASDFDAHVHVVHAVPPLGELASAVVRSHCSDAVKKEVLASTHVTGLLDTIRDEIFQAFTSTTLTDDSIVQRVSDVVVEPGQPANVILREAERSGADLIVIGSHGTEAIDGRILGSVAAKILQLSKVPVFMIPMMDPATMLGMSNDSSQAPRFGESL